MKVTTKIHFCPLLHILSLSSNNELCQQIKKICNIANCLRSIILCNCINTFLHLIMLLKYACISYSKNKKKAVNSTKWFSVILMFYIFYILLLLMCREKQWEMLVLVFCIFFPLYIILFILGFYYILALRWKSTIWTSARTGLPESFNTRLPW